MVSTYLENFLPLSLNLKLSSAKDFSLGESKNLLFGFKEKRRENEKCLLLAFSPFPTSSKAFFLRVTKTQNNGNGLTHSHTMTLFDGSGKEAFGKHCGKSRNCLYKQFLLFPQCILHYQDRNYHFCYMKFVICKCFQFGLVQNFVVWEWIKGLQECKLLHVK